VLHAFISNNVGELPDIGDRLLVIFDGRCGLCNRSVRWLLVRDRRDQLRFVPSESPKVAALLTRHLPDYQELSAGSGSIELGSILVARRAGQSDEELLLRSSAVLELLRRLPGPWPAVATIAALVPLPLRDLVYRLIARYRHRVFGRLNACPIPTTEERARFL
jgi:predicted DCC family thiol-disulfide oxidoreductase YuxK